MPAILLIACGLPKGILSGHCCWYLHVTLLAGHHSGLLRLVWPLHHFLHSRRINYLRRCFSPCYSNTCRQVPCFDASTNRGHGCSGDELTVLTLGHGARLQQFAHWYFRAPYHVKTSMTS
ncbi:hypothetical protein VTK56DRAFT_4464 [Thermocarpiscus australiensis]